MWLTCWVCNEKLSKQLSCLASDHAVTFVKTQPAWTFHFYLRLQWDKKVLGLPLLLCQCLIVFVHLYCTLSKTAELFINTSSPPNLSWTWSRSLWMLSLDVISSWWNWIFVEPSSLLSSAQTSEPAFSSLAAIKECTTIWHWSWF